MRNVDVTKMYRQVKARVRRGRERFSDKEEDGIATMLVKAGDS